MIAPFGGHMLVTFEEHLRTFGNPISNTPSGKNTAIVEPRSGILARGGKERKGRNSLQTVFFFLVFRDFREEPAAGC